MFLRERVSQCSLEVEAARMLSPPDKHANDAKWIFWAEEHGRNGRKTCLAR